MDTSRQTAPPQGYGTRTLYLDGLGSPGEILIDNWGIPHIYADSLEDVFRLQGFNAARDRLWQIDFWRRRGLGLLSEILGADYVERDRAARLFLYRGTMHDEWHAYGPDVKRAVTAFVGGVNAWVELTREDPSLLPPEFTDLGYLPALWCPEDVVRIRSHGLYYNVRQEVARALVLRDFGPEIEELRRRREPPAPLAVPEGLDLNLVPDDVLAVYDLATTPPAFPAQATPQCPGGILPEGSNNWVLAGGKTSTGRPMLANDPHRAVGLPGLRYIAHLSAPGLDVIGAGEPGLPGISIGHNGQVAFGLTIFASDQEDLYVYRTNPERPDTYFYDGRWEPFETHIENIPIAGGQARQVELKFTRHGPVIRQDSSRNTAFAVRAAWLQPGMAPYLGGIACMRAQNWDQFLTAMDMWGTPPENLVYADTTGKIGWKAGGLTPIRPNWTGILPVPGDGRYEWAGFYDMDQLPASSDDARGFYATANEMNLPADYPPDRTITHDWYAPYRKHRIDDVLQSRSDFTVTDMVTLQTDTVSLPARRVIERLRRASTVSQAAAGRELLTSWDGDLRRDSAAAALFEVWYRRHLRPALLGAAAERIVGPDRRDAAVAAILPDEDLLADARIDLDLLERPGKRLGPEPDRVVDEILGSTLIAAYADCVKLLGDPGSWQWGTLHRAAPAHPLAARLTSIAQHHRQMPPQPRGGSGDTVDNTAYDPSFVQRSGSTFRVVVDVGHWDGSVAMNSPGQSGDPRSAHYDDLFTSWAGGGAFPLLYSRAAVVKATEKRLLVLPRNRNEP